MIIFGNWKDDKAHGEEVYEINLHNNYGIKFFGEYNQG